MITNEDEEADFDINHFQGATDAEKAAMFRAASPTKRVTMLKAIAKYRDVLKLGAAWGEIIKIASEDEDVLVRYTLSQNFDHLPESVENRLGADENLDVAFAPAIRRRLKEESNRWTLAALALVTVFLRLRS